MDLDPITNLPWGTSPFKATSSEAYTPFAAFDNTPFPPFVMDPHMTPAPFDASSPPYNAASPAYPSDFGSPMQRPSLLSLQRDSLNSVPSLTSTSSSYSTSLMTPVTADAQRVGSKDGSWFAALQEQYLGSLANDAGKVFGHRSADSITALGPRDVPASPTDAELELERLLMGTPGPLFSIPSPPRPPQTPAQQPLTIPKAAEDSMSTPISDSLTLPVTPVNLTRHVSEQITPVSPRVEPAQRSVTNPLPGENPATSTVPEERGVEAGPPTPDPTPARKVKPLPKRKPSTGVSAASDLRRGSFSREGAWTRRRSSAKANAAAAAAAAQKQAMGLRGPFGFNPAAMTHPPQGFISDVSYQPMHPQSMGTSMQFASQHIFAPSEALSQPGPERSLLFGASPSAPRALPLPTLEITASSPALPEMGVPQGLSHAAQQHGVVLSPDDYHLLSELDPLSLGSSVSGHMQAEPMQEPMPWRQSFIPGQPHLPVDLSYGDFFVPQAPLGRPLAPPTSLGHNPALGHLMAPFMEQSRSAPIPQRQVSQHELAAAYFVGHGSFSAGMPNPGQAEMAGNPPMPPQPRRRRSSFDSPQVHQHLAGILPLLPPAPINEPQTFVHRLAPPPLRMDLIPSFSAEPFLDGIQSAPPIATMPLPPPSRPSSFLTHASLPLVPSLSAAGRQIVPLPSRAASVTPTPEAGPSRDQLGLAPPTNPHAHTRRRATAPGVPTLSTLSRPTLPRTPSSSGSLAPPTTPTRVVSTPSRLAAAKSATIKSGGRVSQGPGNSMFINFTSRDSQKLLKGVAPSGSSKRKREAEDDLALEQGKKASASGNDRRRVVTA